jgi:hypothetical protein
MPKRRIIIRKSDFESLRKGDLKQYQSYQWQAFSRSFFERRIVYYSLREKQSYIADQYALVDYPNQMIAKLTQFKLYDRRYPQWLIRWKEENLLIRAGLRQPESQLGYLTLVGDVAPKHQIKLIS